MVRKPLVGKSFCYRNWSLLSLTFELRLTGGHGRSWGRHGGDTSLLRSVEPSGHFILVSNARDGRTQDPNLQVFAPSRARTLGMRMKIQEIEKAERLQSAANGREHVPHNTCHSPAAKPAQALFHNVRLIY